MVAVPMHSDMRTRDLALTALFAAVTAVCAQISITVPILTAVPFTLQVFAVLVAGAALGARRGALSQCVYLLLGAIGLPVFARLHGGVGALLGPTAGYLWSFPIAAWLVGRGADAATGGRRAAFVRIYAGMAAGIIAIYAAGVLGLYASGAVPSPARAVRLGVFPFIWFDVLKAYVAGLVAVRVRTAIAGTEQAPNERRAVAGEDVTGAARLP
jgi:biotin transport system substrate-specific component